MPGSSRKGWSIDLNGYRKDRTIEVSGETSLLLTAASFVLFFVSAAAVLLVFTLVSGTDSFTFTASSPTDLLPILALVLLVLLVGVLHEGLHALAYLLLHRRPVFGRGRKALLLYCSCSADGAYTRDESVFVLTLPFVLITALGLGAIVLAPAWGIAALVLVPLNAAGSAADLYAAAALLRSPAESQVLEERGAMTLFVPE